MSFQLVIAEKPSVARSIAAVIGATEKQNGYWQGGGYLVSWCIGHLVSFAEAGQYDEKYCKWKYEDLPILPLSALLEEYPGLKALFSEQQWASRTYYRRIYAVPARAVSMYQIGFLARADWMRELGARPEKITDLDALHDLLMQDSAVG